MHVKFTDMGKQPFVPDHCFHSQAMHLPAQVSLRRRGEHAPARSGESFTGINLTDRSKPVALATGPCTGPLRRKTRLAERWKWNGPASCWPVISRGRGSELGCGDVAFGIDTELVAEGHMVEPP